MPRPSSSLIEAHCRCRRPCSNADTFARGRLADGTKGLPCEKSLMRRDEHVRKRQQSRKHVVLYHLRRQIAAGLFFRDLSAQVIQDDVFAGLLTFPNVLVTAHQGFFTKEALRAISETTPGDVSNRAQASSIQAMSFNER